MIRQKHGGILPKNEKCFAQKMGIQKIDLRKPGLKQLIINTKKSKRHPLTAISRNSILVLNSCLHFA